MSATTEERSERVLGDLLCFDLYSLSRTVTALYRPVLDPHGLTYPQYLVLVVLTRLGSGTIKQIGAATRLDHGTLTPLLRRMADRDLIRLERAPGDGRAVTVSLTAHGEALRPVLDEAHCRLGAALGLSEPALHDLQRSLQTLADHLDDVAAD